MMMMLILNSLLAFHLFSSFIKIPLDPLHQLKSIFCSHPFPNLIQASRCGRGWNCWRIIGAARSFSNVALRKCCCRSLQQRDRPNPSGARRLSNREPSEQHHQRQRGGCGHHGHRTVAGGAERSFATTQERKEAMTLKQQRLCKVCEAWWLLTFKKWWWPQKKEAIGFFLIAQPMDENDSYRKNGAVFFPLILRESLSPHKEPSG